MEALEILNYHVKNPSNCYSDPCAINFMVK